MLMLVENFANEAPNGLRRRPRTFVESPALMGWTKQRRFEETGLNQETA